MTMIRKQFFIDPEASRRLKQAAARRGVSEADLIRQGIEKVLGDERSTDEWKTGLRQHHGMWSDRTDLDEFYAKRREVRRRRRTKALRDTTTSNER